MPAKKANTGLSSNEMLTAILSYLWILVLVPFFAIDKKERNDFIKFHLEQGMNFFIATLIIWVVVFIITAILAIIPVIGWAIAALINLIMILFDLFVLVIAVIAIIKAVKGEKWVLPIFGKIKIMKL